MNQVELIATAAFGLEAIVEREVQKLGFTETRVEDGRVRFKGDVSAICKANLWLRCADRVLVVIGEFHCPDFEQLFERTKEMPWEDWLPVDAAFPVYAKSVKSMLTATPSVQRAVKKAIVERLKTKHQRIWFEENGPEYPIEISLLNDRATLTIDTSGEGLHKRGYRQETTDAPMKETLAAALIQLSYWNRDRILVDPCCGSGTIPIEAALIARNMPPGADRSFAAEMWPQVPMKLWTEARKEARDLRQKPLEQAILASDMDPQVIRLARKHASDAGVGMDIHFERKMLAEFTEYREYGCMIMNPPYGERMGDRDSVDQLNEDFGELMRMHPTWSFYCITAHPGFERLVGRPADRRRKLYNGRIECTYYQYQGPRPPREIAQAEIELADSIPAPPSDFKPLKAPLRGPAVGKSLDEFVTTTPLEDRQNGVPSPARYFTSDGTVPPPPSDFKPLKPPTRGTAAGKAIEEFVTTTPIEEGSASPGISAYNADRISPPPSDFKPLKPPTRGAAAGKPVEEFVTTTPLEEGPVSANPYAYTSSKVPAPPSDFKPLKPPTRGPLATKPAEVIAPAIPVAVAAIEEPLTAESSPEFAVEDTTPETPAVPEATPFRETQPPPSPIAEVWVEVVAPVAEPVGTLDVLPDPVSSISTDEDRVEAEPSSAIRQTPSSVTDASADAPTPIPSPVRNDVPSAIASRIKTLDFKPNRPPQRGPLAQGTSGSPVAAAAPTFQPAAPAEALRPTTARVIPPPPPGFKPLKPPTRVPQPVAVPVVVVPVVAGLAEHVAPPLSTPEPVAAKPVEAPVLPLVATAKGLSLTEMAARTAKVAEIVVDW